MLQAVEVLVQGLEVLQREREQRRVGMVGLGQRNDLRRPSGRRRAAARPARGPSAMAAAMCRASRLRSVSRCRKRVHILDAEARARAPRARAASPGRRARSGIQLAQPCEEAALSSFASSSRMDRCGRPQLAEPHDRRVGLALVEQLDQLLPQPRPDRRGRCRRRRPRQRLGVLVHAEAETALVAHRAEDARRVVDERLVVEDADRSALEVLLPAERIDEPAVVVSLRGRAAMALTVKSRRKRSSSIPAALDRGQRRRRGVRLTAGGDGVDVLAVAVRGRPPSRTGRADGSGRRDRRQAPARTRSRRPRRRRRRRSSAGRAGCRGRCRRRGRHRRTARATRARAWSSSGPRYARDVQFARPPRSLRSRPSPRRASAEISIVARAGGRSPTWRA